MTPLLWQRPSQNQGPIPLPRHHQRHTHLRGTSTGRDDQAARVDRAADRNTRVPQMQTENGGEQVTYTPSTDRVRDAYVRALRNAFIASAEEHAEEFDRWLRDHDAQVWAEGYGDDLEAHTPRNNPYRKERI